MVLVAPSILSSDFSKLGEEIRSVDECGADWIHLDVMDGHFVPNLTFGAPVIGKLRRHSKKLFDAHLMINSPENLLTDFIDAGVDSVTIHVETSEKINQIFSKLKEKGVKCGITLNPDTPIDKILPYLKDIDLVLVMSVNPGFSGQKFNPVALDKIKYLDQIRKEKSKEYHYLIQVDGGINAETIEDVKSAGVDVVVAGSYIFGNNDYKERISSLR